MKLICNGIEKETKYSNGWHDSHNRQWIYEDMETNHLLNVYHHIKNNIKLYLKLELSNNPSCKDNEAMSFVKKVRSEIKSELLSRGLDDSTIENHIEERWKMGPYPRLVAV